MKASEARRLCDEATCGVLRPAMESIYGCISRLARQGLLTANLPFVGALSRLNDRQRDSIATELRRQGYTVKYRESVIDPRGDDSPASLLVSW